ncbi:hypothetical protein DAETH_11800 [Deinococcus aetherius]|uniref:TNase-like domain-containing protein n=1 Tax=Deinococcus aetherius TaxID=200252 RepID=A0ABM8ABT5_9DEIO|nr:hypothetical protein DAETH_11800 [Deinococcus aetherius]
MVLPPGTELVPPTHTADEAKANRLGLWAGSLVRPGVYRKTGNFASIAVQASRTTPPYTPLAVPVVQNCTEVRAAGRAPRLGGAGLWGSGLDRNEDRTICK